MKDYLLDDLETIDSATPSSGSMISLDEMDEYVPPFKLKPVDTDPDYAFLIPSERPDVDKHAYFTVIPDAEEFVGLLSDLDKPIKPALVPVKPPKDEVTPEMRLFLTHYMGSGVVSTALKMSKISTAKYRKWLETSPKFAQAMLDSTDALADRLESEALKQALSGNTKVLLKSLEALRPHKWGRSSTVNTFLDGKLKVEIVNWADLVQKAEVIDVTPTLEEGE